MDIKLIVDPKNIKKIGDSVLDSMKKLETIKLKSSCKELSSCEFFITDININLDAEHSGMSSIHIKVQQVQRLGAN